MNAELQPPVVAVGMLVTDDLAKRINAASAELRAWRMAHFVGAKFLEAIKRDPAAGPLVVAVESYRQAIEQVLAESGFPCALPGGVSSLDSRRTTP